MLKRSTSMRVQGRLRCCHQRGPAGWGWEGYGPQITNIHGSRSRAPGSGRGELGSEISAATREKSLCKGRNHRSHVVQIDGKMQDNVALIACSMASLVSRPNPHGLHSTIPFMALPMDPSQRTRINRPNDTEYWLLGGCHKLYSSYTTYTLDPVASSSSSSATRSCVRINVPPNTAERRPDHLKVPLLFVQVSDQSTSQQVLVLGIDVGAGRGTSTPNRCCKVPPSVRDQVRASW
jgi:hypothetical protein